VHATAGVGGGYQLGAGTRLPPLLLDDEEAIATAVSLLLTASDTALSALTKLDQVMPPRLRAEVRAVHAATETLLGPGVTVDAELLVTLARACRDHLKVRFVYAENERAVEPVRMVATNRRWYLMAWDIDRADWRTFRLDRVRDLAATTWRFTPRDHPDPVAHVQHSVAQAPYRHVGKVRLRADPDQVRALISPQAGQVTADEDGWCVLTVGGEDLGWMAVRVAMLGFQAQVLEPPELRAAAGELASRLTKLAHDRP